MCNFPKIVTNSFIGRIEGLLVHFRRPPYQQNVEKERKRKRVRKRESERERERERERAREREKERSCSRFEKLLTKVDTIAKLIVSGFQRCGATNTFFAIFLIAYGKSVRLIM